MNEIKIKIEAPELSKAIVSLANALSGNTAVASKGIDFKKATEDKKQKTEKVEESEVQADPLPESMQEDNKQVDKPKKNKIKLEDVRGLLANKSRNGKKNEVKALISKFNAKKLTDVDPKHYSEMMELAEEL